MPKRPYGIINLQKHSIPIEERNLSLTPKGPLAPGTTGLLPCRTDGSLMHTVDSSYPSCNGSLRIQLCLSFMATWIY